MKHVQRVLVVILAAVWTVFASAVSGFAADSTLFPENSPQSKLASLQSYALLHPVEMAEVLQELETGSAPFSGQQRFDGSDSQSSDPLAEMQASDPDAYSSMLELWDWTRTGREIAQASALTVSPRNQGRIVSVPPKPVPEIRIAAPASAPSSGLNLADWLRSNPIRRFVLITLPDPKVDQVILQPFCAYADPENDLVIWCIVRNQTSEDLVLNGVYSVQFNSKDKVVARSLESRFSTPIHLSSRSGDDRYQPGLQNGVSNTCLVKFIFEPGAYDSSIDLGDADELNGSCEWMAEKSEASSGRSGLSSLF